MSTFAKFYFRPSEGEWIHTTVTPEDASGSGIYGKVEEGGKPVKNALVLLFKTDNGKTGDLLSAITTDDEGEFVFGPLTGGQLYVIKVFKDSLKLRELEITV